MVYGFGKFLCSVFKVTQVSFLKMPLNWGFTCNLKYFIISSFLDSSMVEHAAVNRGVVGSSPTRGAEGEVRT